MIHYIPIKDFRKTPTYLHAKLCIGATDIQELLLTSLDRKFVYMENDVTLHIKGSSFELNHSTVPRMGVFDGIYDIWLRNCKNVTHISIEIEGINEPVYTRSFCKADCDVCPENIQIPLAFEPDGERVQYMLYDEKFFKRYVSCIPANGLIRNTMTINLNEGAEATLELSTVYMPTVYRRDMANTQVYFYINGKEYMYYFPKFMKVISDDEPLPKPKKSICDIFNIFKYGKC